MDRNELELLVLGALLHDIGKFAQRAGAPKSEDTVGYCPTDAHGRPSHTHVLYSDYFIEEVLPLPPELEGHRSRLARLASSHHKPASDDLLEQALNVADRLSAGTDRIQGEESEGDYKSARLLSIFEQISLKGSRALKDLQQGCYHQLSPIEENPYSVPMGEAQQSDYPTLWKMFVEDLHQLPCEAGVTHYMSSLISLLEKYTWCIPSSTFKSLSDISLYDHALTTAAIAQALLSYHRQEGGTPGFNPDKEAKFLLCGGDLSGIQRYIFGLDKSQGSGVAKLLRARSFYLQALTRSVIIELLERLGLSPVARIMDAGGRFVLLLPATDQSRQLLPAFELEVQHFFFERFQGNLSLNLSWEVELTEKDLELKHFQAKLNRFNDALEARKLNQFDRLLEDGGSPVLGLDYDAYKDHGDCAVCHQRPADIDTIREHRQYYGREIKLCQDCGEQVHLIGRKLPRSTYLIFSRGAEAGAIELFAGQTLRLVDRLDRGRARQNLEIVNLRRRGEFAYQPIAAHLPEISEDDLAQWKAWGELQERDGQTFYGEDMVSVGDAKTFALLALAAREESQGGLVGRSFLGAFKADVDNLGLIFSVGLQERLSMSRFASLSRMLNHFFSDDLVRFIKQSPNFRDLYVVFAGGDDLFLIGPWRQTVRFAEELRMRFAAYVAGRPELTLSAGVAVVKPHLPVQSIAQEAENLLEESKKRSGKDGVSLFATTVGWDDYRRLLDQGDWLHGLVQAGAIPKGLLSRLLYYGREHHAFKSGEIKRGIYLSHMAYDFARNLNEKKMPDAAEREKLLGIKQDEFLLEHMRLSASYALYRLRKDS